MTNIPSAGSSGDLIRAISEDPLNPGLHLAFALNAASRGKPHLAYAELKSAQHLGAEQRAIDMHAPAMLAAIPEKRTLSHNQFFRLSTIAAEIRSLSKESGLSILDLGGGDGKLASFIPEARYCLADVATNGISGIELPFPAQSFDYVVACHVLEHIPIASREHFLDNLLARARRGVIILNPFSVEGTHVTERIQLVIDITNAQWAKEHLDCTLPTLPSISDYASRRNLQVTIKPNGTMATSLAFVFLEYFAAKAMMLDRLASINAFFNEDIAAILDSESHPTAHLVCLHRPFPGNGQDKT